MLTPKDWMEIFRDVLTAGKLKGMLPVKNGGTGATTAFDARKNLETNLRTYMTLEQIGITPGEETIETIVNTLQGCCILTYTTGDNSNYEIYPDEIKLASGIAYGTCIVIREDTRISFEFIHHTSGRRWIGSYYIHSTQGGWSGWKEIFTTNGGNLSGSVLLITTNAYKTFGVDRYTDGAPTGGARFGVAWAVDGSDAAQIAHLRDNKVTSYLRLHDCILELYDSVNNKNYNILGEHNKPSGTYTGNGSSTERTIDIGGIGNTLVITSDYGVAIVTKYGAIVKTASGNSVTGLAESAVKFADGVLTIKSSSSYVNGSGYTYSYQVL